jgi:hypothetical protein
LLLLLLGVSTSLKAQIEGDEGRDRDTSEMQSLSDLQLETEPIDSVHGHNVKEATLWALIPGGGQIYNGKYWKLPFVYGAIGTAIYFAYDNHQSYKLYINSFYALNGDTNFEDAFNGRFNERQLIELQDIYRRYRDLSIILAVVGYGLQILDAHVDAHLYYYDVSDDLSLHWEPTSVQTAWGAPTPGVKFSLHF